MMNDLRRICVFCGSNEGNDTFIIEAAKELGRYFALHNISLVYGAAKIGVMGLIAKEVLDSKGKAIGVIPEFLKKKRSSASWINSANHYRKYARTKVENAGNE